MFFKPFFQEINMPFTKLTIEEMQSIAKSRGGECLSTTYVNWKTKLKWKCSEGHVWWSAPYVVKQGYWCRPCGYRMAGIKRRKSPEEVAKILKAEYPAFPKIDPLEDRRRKLTDAQREEIISLYSKNHTVAELARMFGISYYYAYCITHPSHMARKNKSSVRYTRERRKIDPEFLRRTLQSQRKSFKRRMRDPEFRLFPYLDKLAGETGLKGHTAYMKPSESLTEDKNYKIIRVETKLQGITKEMLVKYIYN